MPNDWLINDAIRVTAGPVTPLAPTISFASGTITIVENSGATNVVSWQATSTPILSVAQISGTGTLGPLSNLTLTNGQATWEILNAALGDDGSVIVVRITDGDGQTADASFTLTVLPAPVVTPPTTVVGAWELPSTITAELSTFSSGVLDVPPGGNIDPDWFDLNQEQIVFSSPTDQGTLPADADVSYTEVIFTAIQANPSGTNCPTINIGFLLSWAENHQGNGNKWLLQTRVFIDDGCGDNGGEDFQRTVNFAGPDDGFETWPEIDIEWPPQYEGADAVPEWSGAASFADSAHGASAPPVATLTIDQAPTNPSIVRMSATTVVADGTTLALEELSVVTAGGGARAAAVPTVGPFPPVIDLSDHAGTQVTVGYQSTDSAGRQSAVAEVTVTVPPFTGTRTVGSGEQHTTLTAGLAAVQSGELLIIKAGTYTNNVGEDARWQLIGKSNVTIRAEPGTILDHGTSTTTVTFKFGNTSNCRLENVKFLNTNQYVMQIPNDASGCVLWGCECDGSQVSGTKFGFYAAGGDNCVFGECLAQNLDRFDDGTPSRQSGTGNGFAVGTGTSNTEFWMCISNDNEDGFNLFGETSVGTWLRHCTATGNDRQGLVTSAVTDLRIEDCNFSGNGATSFQIEADSNNATKFSRNVEVRRCTLDGNALLLPGEAGGGWVNDTKDWLVEECTMRNNNVSGGRIDAANKGFAAAGDKTTQFGVYRFNLIENTGLGTSQPGSRLGLSIKGVTDSAFYNNTVINTGNATLSGPQCAFGQNDADVVVADDERLTVVNCIFAETLPNSIGTARQMIMNDGPTPYTRFDFNFYADPPSPTAGYQVGVLTPTDFAGFQTNMSPHEVNSQEVADLMLDAERKPLPGSPLIGAAGDMATVTAPATTPTIHLSSTDWIWVNAAHPEGNDRISFPGGQANVISKTASTVTIDAIPPGGISNGDACNPYRVNGTSDVGAVQS